MADNWFFLSHARLDREADPANSITTFFDDLNKELRRKKVIRQGDAGFFDGIGIQQGSDWPQMLGEALRTCRALICVYSAAYFQSDWCGREWAVFYSRLESYMKSLPQGTLRPRLIMPLLLDPPEDLLPLQLPECVARTQGLDDDYPQEYRENGLKYLTSRMKGNPALSVAYNDLKDTFIRKLIAATNEHPLPIAAEIPDMEKVRSAFLPPTSERPQATAASEIDISGTRYAQFVYVAASRAEIQNIRCQEALRYYGPQGGLDWKLYFPDVEDEVAFLAQKVALEEGFISLPVAPDADLLQLIKEADQSGHVVIIIADTWTLCLDKYRDRMLTHDDFASLNCSVLVARNDKDDETKNNRARLQHAISRAFRKKSRLKDERYFVDTIGSPEELQKFLAVTLQKIRSQIIDLTKDYVAIESKEVINQPIIPGP
jgi:FxsC-like protein